MGKEFANIFAGVKLAQNEDAVDGVNVDQEKNQTTDDANDALSKRLKNMKQTRNWKSVYLISTYKKINLIRPISSNA